MTTPLRDIGKRYCPYDATELTATDETGDWLKCSKCQKEYGYTPDERFIEVFVVKG